MFKQKSSTIPIAVSPAQRGKRKIAIFDGLCICGSGLLMEVDM